VSGRRRSDPDSSCDVVRRPPGRTTTADRAPRREGATIALLRASAVVLLASATLAACPASARDAAETAQAERLVFFLQYVGADYGLAVQAGQATNAFEYTEMLVLTRDLEEGYAALRGDEGSPLVRQGLERLGHLVEHRVAWEEVRGLVRELTPRLAEDLGVSVESVGPLDAERGRELYASACAPCHGTDGAGAGFAAAGMDPPPTSFLDPRMAHLSPHQIVGAVRFGITGTAMPSFEGAFSPEDLWNLATYVWNLRGMASPLEPGAAASGAPLPGLAPALELEAAFAAVADLAFPSVASVGAWVEVDPAAAPGGEGEGAGWREAGPRDDPYPGFRLARSRSGFFVSEEGLFLTNAGAIEPVDGRAIAIVDVEIDNLHYRARVVGVEPTVDIALLKVEVPFATRAVQLAQEESVRVGRWAIALGDPPGPERTFATGTIAARPERLCYQEQRAATLVQTSCRLDPESYGGPVVDISGRVFGITVPRPGGEGPGALAAFAFARQAQALPIGIALTLADAMKARESNRSPWLGFSVLELSRQTRNRRSPRTGVFIDDVFEPSPASRADVRTGDVLTAIDENRVLSVPDFQKWLYLAGIGAKVTLHLSRDGAEIAIPMVIEERPPEAMPSDPTSSPRP
jgi:S1-C subfamily serine protease